MSVEELLRMSENNGGYQGVVGSGPTLKTGDSPSFFGEGGKGSMYAGLASVATNFIPEASDDNANTKFLRENQDIAKELDMDIESEAEKKKMGQAAGAAVSAINPAIGAIYQVGSGIGEKFRKGNEDKLGSQLASDSFNPSYGLFTAFQTGNPLDSMPGISAIRRRNKFTKAKELFDKKQDLLKTSQQMKAGALIKNSLPEFVAPAYGRGGFNTAKY